MVFSVSRYYAQSIKTSALLISNYKNFTGWFTAKKTFVLQGNFDQQEGYFFVKKNQTATVLKINKVATMLTSPVFN